MLSMGSFENLQKPTDASLPLARMHLSNAVLSLQFDEPGARDGIEGEGARNEVATMINVVFKHERLSADPVIDDFRVSGGLIFL